MKTVNFLGKRYVKSIQFGNKTINTDKNGRVFLPTYQKKKAFRYISAIDVLNHNLPPKSLKASIVFVGPTTLGLNWFDKAHERDRLLSDVEIQATTLEAILNKELLYTPYWSKSLSIALILFLGITLGLLLPFLSITASVLLGFFLQILLIVINSTTFLKFGIVLSLAIPMFMGALLIIFGTLFAFLFERQRKTYLKNAFAQYVPPDYLDILLEHPDDYGFEGQSAELTVLFADIRNFTSISEDLSASKVKKMLNKFFTPMTRVILKHGGTIDKYVGDMIMAFWGAPIENASHAEAAIKASLDMLAKTKSLQKKFRALGLPEIELGIGLNTGLMNVGDMGSEFRRSYTVIGDAVNLGSRLQSATAYYGIRLLVGSATRANQTKFIFRLVDKVKFKGKHEAEEIYEVVCHKAACTPKITEELEAHQEALTVYFAKDWNKAQILFQALAQKYPAQKVYQLFVARIIQFKEHSPEADWDGAYTLNEK